MQHHRRGLIVAAAAAAAGVALAPLAGCEPKPDAAAKAPLRMAMDLWAGYFPALLADELGYFREAGLQVEISMPGNTDRMMAEFVAGRFDMVAFALADLINLTRGGHDVQVVLHSDESAGGDQLLLRPGAKLKGQRLVVGTNLGGFGEVFVREYLQRERIDPARVAWVNVDAADVGAALKGGQIDLGHSWEPYATATVAAGAVKVFSSADTPGLIPDVVAALHATIDRRRDDFRAFVAGWFRAQDWWAEHRDEGNRKLAPRLKQTPQWVADSLRGVRLATLADNRAALVGTPPGMAKVLTRYSDFFVAQGALTRPVKTDAVLRGDLLP